MITVTFYFEGYNNKAASQTVFWDKEAVTGSVEKLAKEWMNDLNASSYRIQRANKI